MTTSEFSQPESPQSTSATTSASVSAPQSKLAGSQLAEYVISWRWLFGGLFVFLILCGTASGLYFLRVSNLSGQILSTAQKMVLEAEELKKDGKLSESLKKRMDAANLLDNFNRSQPAGVLKVQVELNSILESIYKDEGKTNAAARQLRIKQIIDSCTQLIQTIASDRESIAYRTRLMELEWERENFAGVIERAKEVQRVEREFNDRNDYNAMRYLTLSIMITLPLTGYNPLQIGLTPTLPQHLDKLLEDVYNMKPSDIEIAAWYAEFIIDVKRETFKNYASQALYGTGDAERQTKALAIIDAMVSRNSENVNAYLTRFRFKTRFIPSEPPLDKLDPDLQAILRLDPNDVEGLILAGLYVFQQSALAARAGNTELADERKKLGEDLLRRNVLANPHYGLGYQYLGEYLNGEGRAGEAIGVWEEGVKKSNHPAVEELVGRLAIALMEQKRFEDAEVKIASLNQISIDARMRRPNSVPQILNMGLLLSARLSANQGSEVLVKAEEAQIAGRAEEARRLYVLNQKKSNDAIQILDGLLGNFGRTHDYVLDRQSVYTRLLPESLLLAGRLFAELGQWDKAVQYFVAANHPVFSIGLQNAAALAAANAYQQRDKPEEAVRILRAAVERSPDNIPLNYYYTQSLFRYQMNRGNPDPQDLEILEERLLKLNEHREQLPQPWIVDLRLVHLEMTKAGLSNNAEQILQAQLVAMRKFRELEKKELPVPMQKSVSEDLENSPEKSQEKKVYSDDIAFLMEIAGIYSSLAQLSDFDRVIQKMRELPNGEAAYYSERINDSFRRNDREGAALIIEEALASGLLTASQKQRFIILLQTLKDKEPNSLDRVYARLKTTFDQNPDSLKPQGFFLSANMAVDREDYDFAKVLLERLKQLDKTSGSWWRYIQVRLLLTEPEPPYDEIRQLQEEIANLRKDWDMAYLLKATIEERYLLQNQEDPDVKNALITAYQEAIRCGNVQPIVWNRLLSLYEETQRTEDAKRLRREAVIRAVALDMVSAQFPQPYQRMYNQAERSLSEEDTQNADNIAKQCVALAEARREKSDLIFSLNLALGKLFFDAGYLDSAKRHLTVVAKRGSSNVYPLAVCLAKNQLVDEGFNLILDEINRTPSSQPLLLPSLLVLLSQIRPSEAVLERVDRLMTRIEKGERQVFRGTITSEERDLDLGERRLRSLVIRFPEMTDIPDPKDIEVYPPLETEEEEIIEPETATEENKTEPKEN
ncbi:MAG: hypothetical protein LBU34_14470 [Planctomycetaceae bacterium]|jgi:tetratricopeptide (TPR) repeat protein|nr:hypothetical protein [Planctomycetaceae bacterium]